MLWLGPIYVLQKKGEKRKQQKDEKKTYSQYTSDTGAKQKITSAVCSLQ